MIGEQLNSKKIKAKHDIQEPDSLFFPFKFITTKHDGKKKKNQIFMNYAYFPTNDSDKPMKSVSSE